MQKLTNLGTKKAWLFKSQQTLPLTNLQMRNIIHIPHGVIMGTKKTSKEP